LITAPLYLKIAVVVVKVRWVVDADCCWARSSGGALAYLGVPVVVEDVASAHRALDASLVEMARVALDPVVAEDDGAKCEPCGGDTHSAVAPPMVECQLRLLIRQRPRTEEARLAIDAERHDLDVRLEIDWQLRGSKLSRLSDMISRVDAQELHAVEQVRELHGGELVSATVCLSIDDIECGVKGVLSPRRNEVVMSRHELEERAQNG
jgi:hypothetical protein